MAGSVYPLVKDALAQLIATEYPESTNYQSPATAAEAMGQDGSGLGIWWADSETENQLAVNVIQQPLRFDEAFTLVLVIQAVGVDTDDTQLDLDLRCDAVLETVRNFVANDPSCGIEWTDSYSNITVLLDSWRASSGLDSQNQRGSRIELTLSVEALLYAA